MDRYFPRAGRSLRAWSRLSGTGVALAAITLILLLFCASALAYTPGKRLWTKTSGTKAHERAFWAGAAGPKGVFYGGGDVYTSAAKNEDALIVKYSSAGKVLWTRTWAGPGANVDEVWYLATTAKGDVFAVVYSSPDGGATSTVVIKYNAAGKVQWTATRPGTVGTGTSPNGLALDRSGNAIVLCTTSLNDSGSTGVDVVKYPSGSATPLWSATLYPDSGGQAAGAAYWTSTNCLALDAAGDAFVAAAVRDNTSPSARNNAVVARFAAADGDETHLRISDYAEGSVFSGVAVRGSVVALAGWAATVVANQQESALVATYDTSLTPQHRVLYRRSSAIDERDFANAVAIGRHGDVFIAGNINQPPPGGSGWYDGCLTARFSPTLGTSPVWANLYKPGSGAKGGAYGNQIVLDGSDNVYVGGYAELPGGMANEDALILKYSPSRTQKWKVAWGDTGKESDGLGAMALGGTNALYAACSGTTKAGYRHAVAMRINR